MCVSAHPPPGMRPERLALLVDRAVQSMNLDLSGATVLTEAATGAYVVTPVLAAVAGAERVNAITRTTRYGTVAEVREQTLQFAALLGVADRIVVHDGAPTRELAAAADVITNSGHVRPIDAKMISAMRPDCVVPLMFESWEIDMGRDDVDLEAMRSNGIRFAGTNERHPAVDVFSYLGPMAVRLLGDGATSVHASRILLICDNPFRPYLERGLRAAGADVVMRSRFDVDDLDDRLDSIVVSLTPRGEPVLTEGDIADIAQRAPGSVLVQFWGDIPRSWCVDRGVPCLPVDAPGAGHMGVLPSAVGPEPIVRLQAGGLKVTEVLRKPVADRTADDLAYVDEC